MVNTSRVGDRLHGTTAADVRVSVHVDAEQVADPWSLLRAFDLALADLETEVAG